jgi:hypothetical protein
MRGAGVPRLVRRRFGKRFGDRGSIARPRAQDLLVEHGVP